MPDERAELADEIFEQHARGQLDLAAPSLWPYEIANALSRAVARGRIADSEGDSWLQTLLNMDIEWINFNQLASRAWKFALPSTMRW